MVFTKNPTTAVCVRYPSISNKRIGSNFIWWETTFGYGQSEWWWEEPRNLFKIYSMLTMVLYSAAITSLNPQPTCLFAIIHNPPLATWPPQPHSDYLSITNFLRTRTTSVPSTWNCHRGLVTSHFEWCTSRTGSFSILDHCPNDPIYLPSEASTRSQDTYRFNGASPVPLDTASLLR